MKVPLNWLSDYVDLTLPVPQLVERLTIAGLEVSGIRVIGRPVPEGLPVKAEDVGPVWDREKILVAEVLEVTRHPDADRLKLVQLNYNQQPHLVVTGAPNIQVGDKGQKVIVALSGSVLFDGHASPKVLRELKPTKIRGIPSDAMVCSAYELGISDEHEGIILLEEDAPVGMPLMDFMSDIVLEIDVLPNMARCLSMIGIAREVAALTGQELRLPTPQLETGKESIDGRVKVEIADPALSARYTAMLLQGIRHGRSPGWMQRRLTYAGMRPISNIVDITNYVMLEWGQPLHAFDFDALLRRSNGKPPVITVRPATSGEVLVTLDNQRRELSAENLIIADEAGPIALAGVMGGAETEVSDATTNVLLESASFDFVSIRRTMRGFNLPSEASTRFSKGVHPELVLPAAERASELMHRHAGASVCAGIAESYPAPPEPQVIDLKLAQVRRLLGTEIPGEEVRQTLESLEFVVEQTDPDTFRVTVPPHRLDVQSGTADLVEELARVHGYDRLPATLLAEPLPEQQRNVSLEGEERVRDILVRCGLHEVITYSLTTPEREAPLGLPGIDYLRLLNPISSDRSVMRHSVLAGVLDVAAANLRHEAEVGIFEIGPVYLPRAGQALPEEPRRLALVLCGKRRPEYWGDTAGQPREDLDFFDLKGVVESLVADLHLDGVNYRPSDAAYLHPGRAAVLRLGERSVGSFGEMHPRVAAAYDLEGRTVLAAELDLEALLGAIPERYLYQPVPRFPAALRDVAMTLDEGTTAEQVANEIRAAGGDLLRGIRLFDLYRGESIAAGKKSLAYALTYQADDRTLTDKEVDRAHKKIEDRLKHMLKAQIRGKDA